MDKNERAAVAPVPAGFVLAAIDRGGEESPLRICVLVREQPDATHGAFLLLRELPGARVYLGAIADADSRIQEWVEVWVQTLELRDLAFSSYQERLANHSFDQRWRAEFEMLKGSSPEEAIVTGMETQNPAPILIKRRASQNGPPAAPVTTASWQICKDDALLEKFGLPPYSTSPFRYLHEPKAPEPKTFLATAADAPANSHVQGIERLKGAEVSEIFNAHAGLIRVVRLSPLGFEDYLQVLEGHAWEGIGPGPTRLFQRGIYADLQTWSARPRGMSFLLHGGGSPSDKLNEIFFLKLSALRDILYEVRAYVKAQQLPLLNLSPASFGVRLEAVGEQFPALWTARCSLVKPGQAHPLKIRSTEQRYFIRMGKTEPSLFLPEGLGAHSFGIGSVRLRNVQSETDGIILEGTLVAEDYLGLDAHDLLWFKLPLAEEKLEFYAHVYTSEAVGPREARFRTVPAKLPEATIATLKKSVTAFSKSPYEIWPLLSSPCDLHSLGIIGIRILLANSQTNLPVTVDDVLGLARRLGKEPTAENELPAKLQGLLQKEKSLKDLLSPHHLIGSGLSAEQAQTQINYEIWLETMTLLLRLFPGAGTQSFCKSFGDVSPLALETVFDRPLQELDALVLRLRSALTPSLAMNDEIARVILEELAKE
jgi:hypothetical protein